MALATKKCKVCGKEYEYCHTMRRTPGVFRYQDVACCPEHGSIYLARIIASRSTQPITDFSDLDECENEDTWFEEDFDDNDLEDSIIEY